MLKVGLTGGIACGKSYALKEFARLGVHGIDLDRVAHKVIEAGQPGYERVVEAFGEEILDEQRQIDRRVLGEIVFNDPEALKRLNGIVHPLIFEQQRRLMAALEDPLSNVRPAIAMVDAALMVETGSHRQYDVLIVVYCKAEIQLRRLLYRDGISEDQARKRIESQMPLLEKVQYADYVIENSSTLSRTRAQIHQTFAELISKAEEL